MNKKISILFIIFGLLNFVCCANTGKKYITSTEITDGENVIGKVETIIFMTDIDENTIKFNISKSIEPFPQLLNIEIFVLKGKTIYNFNTIDNWGNEAYGNIKLSESSIELYLVSTEKESKII